uniref:Uncharacterized protein n=1 Tax=Rhizochromulina marina TaxID=1034831 RepID=A0A7S2S6Y7_9STRA|mmetsp:Transcript_2600/g.7613  ORF Transcript_2600/g.7613 Transcript_2600/m.7613 type:complete len:180 (+) Transcript_2600:280-819(+)
MERCRVLRSQIEAQQSRVVRNPGSVPPKSSSQKDDGEGHSMCAVESVVSLVTWELRVGILACVFLIIQSILPMGYNAVGKAHGAAALLAFLGVLILIAIDCKAAAMCFPTTTTVGTIAGFILWAVAAASIGLWLATFFDVYEHVAALCGFLYFLRWSVDAPRLPPSASAQSAKASSQVG